MPDSVIKVIDGKKLEICDLDPGDMLDLFESIGARPVGKAWLVYANAACSVRTIDDVPVVFPKDVDAIKRLARQIGTNGMSELLDLGNVSAESAEESKEAAKNLAGTPS